MASYQGIAHGLAARGLPLANDGQADSYPRQEAASASFRLGPGEGGVLAGDGRAPRRGGGAPGGAGREEGLLLLTFQMSIADCSENYTC